LFVSLFPIYILRDSGVRSDQRCAEQQTADDVTEPVYTGEKAPDNHEGGEYCNRAAYEASERTRFDTAFQLQERCRHDTGRHERGRRRVGDFQPSADQYWTVIDGDNFKNEISRCHGEIEAAQPEQITVDVQKISAPDPLHETEQREPKGNTDRHQPQPVGERIQSHMCAGERMEKTVDCRKPDGGAERADWLNIHEAQCGGPEQKCCEHAQRNADNLSVFFLQNFVHPFLLSGGCQNKRYGTDGVFARNRA